MSARRHCSDLDGHRTVVKYLERSGISQYSALVAQTISLANIAVDLSSIAESLERIADKLDPR